MQIYLYDKNTLEYIMMTEAEADPEETKLQGHFVPLMPANSTKIKPPEYNENEIPIFAGDSWIVYPDFRNGFYTVDENFSVKKITTIGVPQNAIVVTKEIGEEILKNPDFFKIEGKQIIRKTPQEREEDIIKRKQKQFEKDFFKTSLGWIRRKVTMKDGSIKDFLSDLVLSIKAGIELGEDVLIITYQNPDFSCEFTKEYFESLQEFHYANMEFIKECLRQTVKDFGE